MWKALFFLLVLKVILNAPANHQVKSLKGFYDFSSEFKMYSGYLTLQQSPAIKNHYIFITSKKNPETSDVVLWLNGGPGCSSLYGFLTQNGPHMLQPGAETMALTKNPYSWNNNANILYIQSPPGVGFSINEDPNYLYNDTRTGKDNLQSLKQWFKLFPQYSNNKFWITGQSYAGMFIPHLADEVLKNIDSILPAGRLNFQGLMIGNCIMITDLRWRRKTRNTFYSRHYFYGPEINELLSKCKYDQSDDANPACLMGNKLADEAISRINPYNAMNICYDIKIRQNNEDRIRKRYFYSGYDDQMYNLPQNELACSSDDNGMYFYFNDKEVQEQLHVPYMLWEPCSTKIPPIYNKAPTSYQFYESFKQAGLKIMLFSGNVDAQVSYLETQQYIRRIGWKQMAPKRSVKNPRGSLQGWYTKYDGLILYIVNGAGHMVPTDKPGASLRMFQSFIFGKL